MHRRTLLGLPALAALAPLVAGCGGGNDVSTLGGGPTRTPDRAGEGRYSYGSDPSQFGELFLPDVGATPKGLVVVIHGGFWLAEYDYTLGTPLATSLAQHGWAAWNIEYRRVGDGGGDPQTMDDVAAAIDKAADLDLPAGTLDKVVALGHSAGGQLAGFAASRSRFPQWSPSKVQLTHVIAQAGVMDLRAAYEENLGGGAVKNFLGHAPGPADDPVDPIRQVPLSQPVWCVHGNADTNVPISQSKSYVSAATTNGATADFVEVQGDHFALIDTTSSAWARILQIFDTIA